MKDFQARLKRHMDHGATYLEALHLLKTTENKQPSKMGQAIKKKSRDRQKHSS
ncbi:hypothetical protein [Ammoniphilus oxalaticus]|uniref:hypothetical protein n=1 Tax=Ammoniphilus oxalaticus TaxID=66863 RepID=UPI001474B71A|nr:hypothetical protein [Ammoniphilus oxalaticus]